MNNASTEDSGRHRMVRDESVIQAYLCEKTLFETGKEKATRGNMAIDRRKTDVLNLCDRTFNANSNILKKTYHL